MPSLCIICHYTVKMLHKNIANYRDQMKFVNGCLQVALCVYVLDSEGLVIISFFFSNFLSGIKKNCCHAFSPPWLPPPTITNCFFPLSFGHFFNSTTLGSLKNVKALVEAVLLACTPDIDFSMAKMLQNT